MSRSAALARPSPIAPALLVAAGRDRTDLDAPAELLAEVRGRVERGHADRLVEVARLDQEEAADLLLALDERSVRDERLAVARAHRRGRPLEALRHDDLPGAAQLLVVDLAARDQRLELSLRQGLHPGLVAVGQAQVLHRRAPSWSGVVR